MTYDLVKKRGRGGDGKNEDLKFFADNFPQTFFANKYLAIGS